MDKNNNGMVDNNDIYKYIDEHTIKLEQEAFEIQGAPKTEKDLKGTVQKSVSEEIKL